MKKIMLFLSIQFIFCCKNIRSSQAKDSYSKSNEPFQEIKTATVSAQDAPAYTWLVRLRVRTFDLHFAQQQKYSKAYQRHTRELYNQAKAKAQEITATENPKILEALEAALQYAGEVIK